MTTDQMVDTIKACDSLDEVIAACVVLHNEGFMDLLDKPGSGDEIGQVLAELRERIFRVRFNCSPTGTAMNSPDAVEPVVIALFEGRIASTTEVAARLDLLMRSAKR